MFYSLRLWAIQSLQIFLYIGIGMNSLLFDDISSVSLTHRNVEYAYWSKGWL